MASKKESVSQKISVSPGNSRKCVFCQQSQSDEINLGGLKSSKTLRAHYYCLLLSETIKQLGQDSQGILGFMPGDIMNELRISKRKQCCYCKEFGASLGCQHIGCNRKFHLPCGLKNNAQLNFNDFSSKCHRHRKVTNIPVYIKRALSEYNCVICLEYFDDDENISNIIWADCCKSDVVFHIQCIRELALNAGYFTKCPGCNNKSEFVNSIKSLGVFVPERDASWELERNAFSDLLYVHDRCDVTNCICPQGRNFKGKGQWKLVLCNLCGSFGIHTGCFTPDMIGNKIICDVCKIEGNHPRNDGIPQIKAAEISNSVTIQEVKEELSEPTETLEPLTDDSSNNQQNLSEKKNIASTSDEYELGTQTSYLPGLSSPRKRKKAAEDVTTELEQCDRRKYKKFKKFDDSHDSIKCGDSVIVLPSNEGTLLKDDIAKSPKQQKINISSSAKLDNLINFVQDVVENHNHSNHKAIEGFKGNNDCALVSGKNHLNKDAPFEADDQDKESKFVSIEGSPTYKISLDTNSEIEFVSCPDFNVTKQNCSHSLKKEGNSSKENMLLDEVNKCVKAPHQKKENYENKAKHTNLKSPCSTSGNGTPRMLQNSPQMQKKFMPVYNYGRRIIKINFGNNATYYARVPFHSTAVSYKWNLKLKQRR